MGVALVAGTVAGVSYKFVGDALYEYSRHSWVEYRLDRMETSKFHALLDRKMKFIPVEQAREEIRLDIERRRALQELIKDSKKGSE